ncbi:hypothetical protein [Flammeovirga kamogawensis]|uniref:Lipoprotein n=1 Tax=Flammeovirga kamogawensis TaxID=373891 RepID=A0ABX8GXU2_9BACT|nr:hypothetical protein [Flammeovirga kamogawensis]MBB6460768.1 hypothetical protein [Flammeovirga kamogawensis]QWG08121.1 hypothetical protein KM029_04055 [Flammeovirga kamogawensis]TRX69924.1 hypothetical protein EO216_17995 [Flammeovirga kamogawensis]
MKNLVNILIVTVFVFASSCKEETKTPITVDNDGLYQWTTVDSATVDIVVPTQELLLSEGKAVLKFYKYIDTDENGVKDRFVEKTHYGVINESVNNSVTINYNEFCGDNLPVYGKTMMKLDWMGATLVNDFTDEACSNIPE